MNGQFKKEWDLFLVLEVGFFFPYRKQLASPPANRAQIGVLLADREHIALVIADANQQQAASYLTPKYEEFWKSIVPDAETIPEKTVTSRMNRAVRLLSSALDGQIAPICSPVAASPTGSLPCPTQAQFPYQQESALSRYLQYALPEETRFVPDAWQSAIPRDDLGRLTIIQGRTGTGKTQLMRWLAHEFRRRGATPVYLDLPSYAGRASEEDTFVHVSTHGAFATRYREPGVAVDLQRELAEEERQGALVILADCPDELFDSDIPTMDGRLASLSHVVLAERSEVLPMDAHPNVALNIPTTPPDQIDELLETVAGLRRLSVDVINELRYQGLGTNLGLLIAAAQLPPALGLSGQVRVGVERWIDQRLRATRQVGGHSSELFVARKLLEILASIEVGLEGPREGTKGYSTPRIEYALRRLEAWVPLGKSSEVFAFLRRTGLVNPTRSVHVFSYPNLAQPHRPSVIFWSVIFETRASMSCSCIFCPEALGLIEECWVWPLLTTMSPS